MHILYMLNILRLHGIPPSAIPSNISLRPNHQIVNEINKLRAKLKLRHNRYQQARVLYKKVIKPINIAFIKSLYDIQKYVSIHNYNPVLDYDYLFGQYDNKNIENPALYRLLREHRSQRNLIKFIILTHFCNKPDITSDEEFNKVIALLEARMASHPHESDVICLIMQKLVEKDSSFIKIGLAKAKGITGGGNSVLTDTEKKSLDVILIFGALAIDDKEIRDFFKKFIERVGSSNSSVIVKRIDEVVADTSILSVNKPLLTASIVNPISNDYAKEKEDAKIFINGLAGLVKKNQAEFNMIYLDKILVDPKMQVVKVVTETAAHVTGVTLPPTSTVKSTEWNDEITKMSGYKAAEQTVIAAAKGKAPPKLNISDTDLQEIVNINDFANLQVWYDNKKADIAWTGTGDNSILLKKVKDILENYEWLTKGDGTQWATNWANFNWNSNFLNAVDDVSNIEIDGKTTSIPKLAAIVESMYSKFYKNLVEKVIEYETKQMDNVRTELEKINSTDKSNLLDFMDVFIKNFSKHDSFPSAINNMSSWSRSNLKLKEIITKTINPLEKASDKFRETVIKTLQKIRAQFTRDYSSPYVTVDYAFDDIMNLVDKVPSFEGEDYKDIFEKLIQDQITQLESLKINDRTKLIYGELKTDADAASSMPEIQIKEIIKNTDTVNVKTELDKIVFTSGIAVYNKTYKVMYNSKSLGENELEDIKIIMDVYNNKVDNIDLKSIDDTSISFLGLRFVIVEEKMSASTSTKSLVDLYDSVSDLTPKLKLAKIINLNKLLDLVKSSKLFQTIDAGKKDTPDIYMDSANVCFETTVSEWNDLGTYLYTDDTKNYHEFGFLNKSSKQRIYYSCTKENASGKINFIVGEKKETSINTTNMTGGAYYKKYLKYKSKYLQIK